MPAARLLLQQSNVGLLQSVVLIYDWVECFHSIFMNRDVFSLSSNCSDAKDMEAHKPCGVHGTHTFLRQ